MPNNTYTDFTELKTNLTPEDVDQLVDLIGSRARQATKTRLRSILTYGPSTIPDYGIFRRLAKMHATGQWQYIAGQSYPDEIRTVRECILKG